MRLLIIALFITLSYSKKDFHYSYIDDDRNQLQQATKDKILQSNYKIIFINKLLRNNKINDAYEQIVILRLENKIEVLKSSIELLYAKILYQKSSKKFSVEADEVLNSAINNSIINQSDLLDALKLQVEVNIKINKIKDAKFHANTILKTFNDPLSLLHGKIALAKILINQKKYKKAINSFRKILNTTKDIEIATIVADELFDAYILNKQNEKAKDIASQVLDKNIDYYSTNTYLAQIKINKLVKARMPHLAIKLLKELLKKVQNTRQSNNFKFQLANVYMGIYTKKDVYMLQAKELYKDIIQQKDHNDFQIKSKMYLDEILMRQEILSTQIVANRYANSASMYNKALLQELLTYKKNKQYDKINKLKNVYLQINQKTTRRFGYKNINAIFDLIDSDMIKSYLDDSNCKLLDISIVNMKESSLELLILDENANKKMLECMSEYPNKKSFTVANKIFNDTLDTRKFLVLQNIALKLNLNNEAYVLSQKIDSYGDEELKKEAFLNKFIIYLNKRNAYSMDKFFLFASKNKNYIESNVNDPRIIDFYYHYYLYLLKNNNEIKTMNILNKLYEKQNEMDAHVYSPFVEMQISLNKKLDDDYIKSNEYLIYALQNSRNIKNKDLVQIYYEMAQNYKKLNKENRYKDAIKKCKNVTDVDSLYKKMCSEL